MTRESVRREASGRISAELAKAAKMTLSELCDFVDGKFRPRQIQIQRLAREMGMLK